MAHVFFTHRLITSEADTQIKSRLINSYSNLTKDKQINADDNPNLKLFRNEILSNDLAHLIKLSLVHPEIDEVCKHPNLNDIWEERWRKSGVNPREKAAHNQRQLHEYKPQVTLHTFDLLKGIYIYSQYKKLASSEASNDSTLSQKYLQEAAFLGYFPALNALASQNIDKGKYVEAVIYAQLAAKFYWSPGYLLLSVIQFKLENYQDALLNFIISEKLLPYSEEMTNNAYRGKNREEIIKPFLSAIKARNTLDAKKALASFAQLPLHFITSTLYKQANQIVNSLIKTYSDRETYQDDMSLSSNSLL